MADDQDFDRPGRPLGPGAVHGVLPRDGRETPLGQTAPTGKFGRMCPRLAPLMAPTEALEELGAAMFESDPGSDPDDPAGDNIDIPAGYTYLGQFIDHDITFDPTALQEVVVDPLALHNFRTPALDLDCLYGAGPAVQPYLYERAVAPDPADRFQIGTTSGDPGGGDPSVPPSQPFDLPRAPNGFALIGDPRNDENLIVGQLHLAFLRFHNKVLAGIKDGSIPQESPIRKTPFQEARDLVIWHYQWIVLHDFLARVLDADVLRGVLERGSSVFKDWVPVQEPFMPVEFSAAAYRFGHSMVRAVYDYNRVFTFRPGGRLPATLQLLFVFSGHSGPGGSVPIPSDWIIDWRRFFQVGAGADANPSRSINPLLAHPLSTLPGVTDQPSLAVRNLLRGQSVGLPPAQSITRFLEYEALSPDEIASSGKDGEIAAKHNLHIETPLWYYVLKEAQLKTGGRRLGRLGSRILAEVFVGLLECDSSSFLVRKPGWKPTLPGKTPQEFTMADVLEFAGDLNPIGDAMVPISDRTMQALAQENPDIHQQRNDWQAARIQVGEDPNDWPAFRAHLIAIGAPDPGEEEPHGFRR
jgi:hypothetical protein